MTNGDKLRKLSDKGLAIIFSGDCKHCPAWVCGHPDNGCIGNFGGWLKWLQQETSDHENAWGADLENEVRHD